MTQNSPKIIGINRMVWNWLEGPTNHPVRLLRRRQQHTNSNSSRCTCVLLFLQSGLAPGSPVVFAGVGEQNTATTGLVCAMWRLAKVRIRVSTFPNKLLATNIATNCATRAFHAIASFFFEEGTIAARTVLHDGFCHGFSSTCSCVVPKLFILCFLARL